MYTKFADIIAFESLVRQNKDNDLTKGVIFGVRLMHDLDKKTQEKLFRMTLGKQRKNLPIKTSKALLQDKPIDVLEGVFISEMGLHLAPSEFHALFKKVYKSKNDTSVFYASYVLRWRFGLNRNEAVLYKKALYAQMKSSCDYISRNALSSLPCLRELKAWQLTLLLKHLRKKDGYTRLDASAAFYMAIKNSPVLQKSTQKLLKSQKVSRQLKRQAKDDLVGSNISGAIYLLSKKHNVLLPA